MIPDLIMLYCGIVAVCGAWTYIECVGFEERSHTYFMPKELYNSTKMNIVGCYIISFITFVFNPIFCVPMTIYWLFHIGREN